MGGVSHSAVTAAVSKAGGFGCLGAAIMNHDEMKREIAAVRAATTKPFGVDLLTASPRDLVAMVETICYVGRARLRRRARRAGTGRRPLPSPRAPGRQHVRQGRPREARGRRRLRRRRGAGHRGGRPYRDDRDLAARAADRRRGAGAGRRGGRHLRRTRGLVAALALGAQGIWMGTRFIASDRGARAPRLQGPDRRDRRDRHRDHALLQRQDHARDPHPLHRRVGGPEDELQPFPMQAARAARTASGTSAPVPRRVSTPTGTACRPGRARAGSRACKPCREIVAEIVAQADAILRDLPRPSA